MNKRGFTLIELLIVIAIIGILATTSITAYIGVTKKAARSEAYSNLGSIRLLEEQFFAENACYQPLAGVARARLLLQLLLLCLLPRHLFLHFFPDSDRAQDSVLHIR